MANLSQLRKKYPEYDDMDDQNFADKFHAKYYADMPKNDFYSKIGLATKEPKAPKEQPTSILEDVGIKAARAIPEIASGLMELPGEIKGATNISQTLKNAAIGPIEGAAGLFNVPGNITKYLSEKGYLPKSFGKYAPHIPIHDIEEKLGILPEKKGESLVRTLSGFGLAGKLGKFSEASNLNRAGQGAAYAIGQEQNPITGALLASVPSLVKGGQKAYGYLREPKKALTESQEALESIRHLFDAQKQAGQAEKTGVNSFLNQVQEGLTNRNQNLESQLPSIFPIKPKSETRLNLNSATSKAVNDLNENFNKRYNDFEKQHGATEVKEPFNWHEINLDNLPHVSITTKNLGHKVSNDRLNYTNSEGENIAVNFPSKDATVNDYINFSRELRDAAWDASKSAKNATHAEATSLRKTSRQLRLLQSQAEEKIRASVGEQPFNQYKQIQKDYSQLMGPVKTEPALFNATYKGKISDKLHDTLLQPNNQHIRNYLYRSPEYTDALREHLMQGKNHPLKQAAPFNPASINEDIQYLLTPQQKAAQAERSQYHQAQNQLNDISKYIKKPEEMTPQQEQMAKGFHPKTSEYLSNEAQRREITRHLEQQQKEHQIKKEEHAKILNKRRIKTGVAGAAVAYTQQHKIANLIKKLF
jgi:hypothetical protein